MHCNVSGPWVQVVGIGGPIYFGDGFGGRDGRTNGPVQVKLNAVLTCPGVLGGRLVAPTHGAADAIEDGARDASGDGEGGGDSEGGAALGERDEEEAQAARSLS